MPYKSEAQRRFFNANRKKLESQGVDVDEWNESSKGKKLPERAEPEDKEAGEIFSQLVAKAAAVQAHSEKTAPQGVGLDERNEASKKKKLRKPQAVSSSATDVPLSLLAAPAGLGALSAAAYGAAKGVASDSQVADYEFANKLLSKSDFDTASFPTGMTPYTAYQAILSPGAALKPFGYSPSDVFANLRSSPALMDLASKLSGTNMENYKLLTDVARLGGSGAAHYKAYGEGPLSAYAHNIFPFRDVQVPESLASIGGKRYDSYASFMRRKLDDFLQNKMRDRVERLYPDLSPAEIDTQVLRVTADEIPLSLIPYKEQVGLMRQFQNSLSPEEKQFVATVDGKDVSPGLGSQIKNYKRVGDAVISARNMLTDAATTTAGAAGGAGLGALAYYLLRNKEPEERNKWVERGAVGGGAALGGASAFLLGTERGRDLLFKLINNAAAKYKEVKGSAKDAASRIADPAMSTAAGPGIGVASSGISKYLKASTSDKERRKRRNQPMLSGAVLFPRRSLTQVLKEQLAKTSGEKAANAGYDGYQGMAFQQNLPVAPRRQLTDAEKADVADGQTKWFRGPFASEGDSISRRMASPAKRSLLAALATTAAGAGLGAYGASQSGGNTLGGALAGGSVGALGGIPLGVLAYLGQQQSNKTLEERMRRLPEGNTTLRDMMSDPVTGYGERMNSFQQQMNPAFSGPQLAQIALMAARMPQRQQYKFARDAVAVALRRIAGDKAVKVAQSRCWKGYEPVPGKKPYSDGSCRPVGSKKKKPEGKTEKKAVMDSLLLRELKEPQVLSMPAGPDGALRSFATKHREPRMLVRPFYDSDKTAIRRALEVLRVMSPDVDKRSIGDKQSPLTTRDVDHLGLNLVGMYRNRFDYAPEMQQQMEYEDSQSGSAHERSSSRPRQGATGKPKKPEGKTEKKALVAMTLRKLAASAAWTRAEGKSESGGLNSKGRASLNAEGRNIKPPVTEKNPSGDRAKRRASFCARMSGMKKKLTSSETANDPDSRINKALRKWRC
jgi:hypothetical protein